MLNWLQQKAQQSVSVDIHSHLIPGIDDGVKNHEEALEILSFFKEMGYSKVITTPHIYQDYYPNTRESILQGMTALEGAIKESGLQIKVLAAAEYFVDEYFFNLIASDEPLMSFGSQQFVLIETGIHTKPAFFDQIIFSLQARGYGIVLAHPERYQYLMDDFSWLKSLRENGLKLQLNQASLLGAYGSGPAKIAKRLLKEQMIDFVGSDIHNRTQLEVLKSAMKLAIKPQPLLNDQL